jgi:hypothetical protein
MHRQLAQRLRGWGIAGALLTACGCLTPGRIYLNPPGYSSTFQRVEKLRNAVQEAPPLPAETPAAPRAFANRPLE